MARTDLERLAYEIEDTLRAHVRREALTQVMFDYEDLDEGVSQTIIAWGFRPGVNYKVTIQKIEVGNEKG